MYSVCFLHALILPYFILNRLLICQILQFSVICLSQWELRQRKGNRCLSKDTKKWRTARLKVAVQLVTFHSSLLSYLLYFYPTCCPFKMVHFVGDLSAQCHYCTHYSSAIIVASFLVRIEPFSHTFQALQVRPVIPGNARTYLD